MRCAVYVRVSTNKEEQRDSLKYQQELFYNYIAEKGWDIKEQYIKKMERKSKSTKSDSQKKMKRMNKLLDVLKN